MKTTILKSNRHFQTGVHTLRREAVPLRIRSPHAFDRPPRHNVNNSTSEILQALIDAFSSNVAILDCDQTIRFVNRGWREFASLCGFSVGRSCVGGRFIDLCVETAGTSARDAVLIEKGIASVIEENEISFQIEYRATTTSEPLWFRIHAALLSSAQGGDSSLILVSHDNITTEKVAQDLFSTKMGRIGRLLDSNDILPWEADAGTGRLTYIGGRVEEMFGYPKHQWLEPDFRVDHLHPDDKKTVGGKLASFSQDPGLHRFEYRIVSANGDVKWVTDNVCVQGRDCAAPLVTGYMTDITEQKMAEERLLLLSGRLITAQEDERKRIARELHDDLNQRMALMSIQLEQLGRSVVNKSAGVDERIKELQRKSMRMSQEIHRMSYQLHPSKLDHLGLVPALKSFCEELAESRGIRIHFGYDGAGKALSADITLCLFRVAQEALQNSAKHSGGSEARVTLTISDTAADLHISDSGRGFDIRNGKLREGLGFISMRERLRLVKGSLRIESRPSLGTQIFASVPLARHGPDHPVSVPQQQS